MTIEIFLLLIVLAILGASAVSLYLKMRIRALGEETLSKKTYSFMEIRVSKHGENHFKDVEELYQSLASLHKKLTIFDELSGKVQQHISFEIVANQGSIRFFIRAEAGSVANTVKNYLKARYKQIEITEMPHFPLPLANFPQRKGIFLSLAKPDLIPLKSYKDFDDAAAGFVDSLSALTTTLSTLTDGELVWLQYVMVPMSQKWIKEGEKMQEMQEKAAFKWAGKNQKKYILMSLHLPLWAKILFFPWKIISGIIKIFTNTATKAAEINTEKQALMKQKIQKPLVRVDGRVLYATKPNQLVRENLLTEIQQTFTTFGLPNSNTLSAKPLVLPSVDLATLFEKRESTLTNSMVLNTEELALLWHPPTKVISSPYVNFIENSLESLDDKGNNIKETQEELAPENAKGLAREMQEKALVDQPMLIRDATCLGVVDSFSKTTPFIIHDSDRRRHVYIIGQTGTGKSKLQEQMILSTIYKGQGCAVIDPHGELIETILKYIPKYRKNDVAIFDPSDLENPPAFNILSIDKKGQELLATELIGVFHRMFESSWGPRMEQILYNALLGIIEMPNATLTDLPAFITTKAFREECLRHCTDRNVIYFWHDQFDVLDPKMQKESVVAVLNKIEKFLNNSIVRGVFGSNRNRFNFDFMMNKQKILLVNLSKGKLSPQNSEIIGSMIVSRLLIDAMKRVEIPEEERKDFFLYIDEFQNFVSSTKTFESILSEARKYRLDLNIAHQYIAQMPDELRAAIFGNVGTIISHRIGLEDAPTLVKQFGENDVSEEMLTTLQPYTFYSRSVRDNKITGVQKVKALRPVEERFPKLSNQEINDIIEFSKKQYCWNEQDRKIWDEKEMRIEKAKKLQKDIENKRKEKKAAGPVMGPSQGAKPAIPADVKEPLAPKRDHYIPTSGNVITPTNLYKPGPKK